MEQKFVKTQFVEINLSDMIEQLGEDETKSILFSFSCPLNKDIENFIKYKAIEFSKRTILRRRNGNTITGGLTNGYWNLP